MKNLSKVLAVVLALVMALSMVSFAAYTDVADDANYAEAVSVLSSLDMLKGYEDGTFKPEGDITRAEFAMVVCRLLGYAATAEVSASYAPFNDVPANHWASGAIALAAQQGIVNGYGNGNFGPEDNVTYEQAIKMVVAALGYTIVAESNGGYPGGFQIVAAQAGILDGITDGKAGVPASRGVVAQLAYNALEVPMMTQTGFGDQVTYNYDNTLLLNRIDVVKVEATVLGTAKTGDYKADEIGLDIDRQFAAIKGNNEAGWVSTDKTGIKPVIDDATWVTAKKVKAEADMIALATELVDYEVEAYIVNPTSRNAKLVAIAMKDAGYSELLFATEAIDIPQTATVSVVTVDGADYAKGYIELFVDETKEETEKYDVNISKVYLNGREITSGAEADFVTIVNSATAEADIRLFDNNGDEVYEIAYVTAYVDFVVDTVSARNNRITALPGTLVNPLPVSVMANAPAKIVLDEENEEYSFEIIKDGEVVDFSAIAVNDVLSIAGGFDSTYTNELAYGTVIINTQKVSGTINGLDTDNDIVYIDGVEYEYKDAIESSLSLGDAADFYINARGIICGLDEASKVGNLKYGFVTVAMESTGLVANTMELRMMDTEGTWNTYVLDKDFELNGADGTVANFKGEGNLVSGKYVYNTVVGYELNADGEIKAIYTDDVNDEFDIYATPGSAVQYNAATEIYDGKIVTDSTVIFSVPTGTANTAIIEEDVVTIASKASLVDRTGYIMTAYNVSEDLEAPVFLGYDITGNIDWTSNFMVITGKTTKTNAEGKVGVELVGLVNGEAVTLFAVTEGTNNIVATMTSDGSVVAAGVANAEADTLAKGDVILFSVDGTGEAAKIVKLVDADDMNTAITGTFSETSVKLGDMTVAGVKYTYYLGYVSEVKGSRIAIQEDRVKDTTATGESYDNRTNLTLKGDTVVTEVNTTLANGVKVVAGDTTSIVADSNIALGENSTKDGDIVFVKAMNDVVIVETVVFKAARVR